MKQAAIILLLSIAPPLFANPMQTPAPPLTNDNPPRSSSGAATSHDKHAHKHRTGQHHRRHHATAKSQNNS